MLAIQNYTYAYYSNSKLILDHTNKRILCVCVCVCVARWVGGWVRKGNLKFIHHQLFLFLKSKSNLIKLKVET